MREQLVAVSKRRLRAKKWATLAVASAVASVFADANVASAATVSFGTGQIFLATKLLSPSEPTSTDDAFLINPDGGYAVAVDSGAVTTATGIAFENGSGATGHLTTTLLTGHATLTSVGSAAFTGLAAISTSSASSSPSSQDFSDPALFSAVTDASVAGSPDPFDLTLNNLTVGHSYVVELIMASARTTSVTAGAFEIASNSTDFAPGDSSGRVTIAFDPAVASNSKAAGGYIDASFTADSTSQNIFLQDYGGGSGALAPQGGLLNDFIVRDQTVATTPNNLVWDNTRSSTGDGSTWSATAGGINQNWSVGGALAASYNPGVTTGDNVVFNDFNHGDYTVNIASNVSPGSVAVTNNFGNYVFDGPGGIGGSTSLTKSGSGMLTLNSSNTYTGSTIVNGGTLEINASAAGALAATTAPNFGGGTLMLLGNASSGATQTLGNVTLSGGGGTITADNNSGSGTTTLNLGTQASANFSNGSSLNITTAHPGSGSSVITTTTGNDATGIIGAGRVVYSTATGTDWASTTSVSAPFVLSGYTGYNPSLPVNGTSSASTNYVVNTAPAVFTASSVVNTLKIADNTANGNFNLGGTTLTLATGGLLYTGTGGYNITNGTLTSGMAGTPDLIVNQYGTGALTISSVIANGTAGLTTLTKTGPGTLILNNTSTNTYTGDTFVNGGIISINADSELGARNTSNVVLNGGEFQYTGAGLTTVHDFILGGSGGIFDIKNGVTYIVGNGAAGSTGTITGTGGLTLTSTGGRLVLQTAGNTFSGGVTINGGIFEIQATSGALNDASAPISFGPTSSGKFELSSVGQDLTITGLSTLSTKASVDDLNSVSTLVVNNSTDSFYNGTILSDQHQAFSLTKMGSATLTLNNSNSTYTGVTNISGGVLSISSFGLSGFSPTITSANTSSASFTVNNATGLAVGMTFISANFTTSTTITAVSGNTITTNAVATSNTTSGVCNIGFNTSLGISTSAASNLIFNGGTLQYTGPSVSADRNYTLGIYGGGLDVSGATAGPLSMNGNMLANGTSGTQTFTLTGSSTKLNTIAGTISDGTGTNQTALAKTGAGTWVLGNTGNTYSGGTTISAGTLQIASDSSLGAASGGIGQFLLTAKGSGYTSQPTVNFSGGGGGSGATVNALMGLTTVAASGGDFSAQVPAITVTGSSGTNASVIALVGVYQAQVLGGGSSYTSAPTVTFSASPTGGVTATGTAVLSGNSIASITITNEGSGYTSLPTITLSGGGGSGATFSLITTLTGLTILSPGSGYTNLASVDIQDPASDFDDIPFNASATGLDVVGLSVISAGTGYTTLPSVSLTGGGGTGAAANASLVGYLTLAGGTLQTSAPFTSSRNIATTSATSAIDTQTNNNTFSGVISGNGALGKLGSGTLTLTNTDIYTGNTNILGGTLAITGSGSIAGSAVIDLVNSSTLDVSETSSTFTVGVAQTLRGQGTMLGQIIVNGTIATGQTTGVANKSAATLTLASGSSLSGSTLLDLVASPGTSDQIVFANGSAGSVTLGGTLFVTNPNGITFAGGQSYDLFNYEGNAESGTFSNVPAGLPTLGGGLQWVTTSLYSTGVISIISSGPASLIWNNVGGSGNGMTWDAVQQNWNNGSGVIAYSNTSNSTTGDNVTFNDSNNGKYAVTISGTVNPTSVTFNNSSGNYTVGGVNASSGIAGSTSLTKFGSGSATLSSDDSYTGGTSVNDGTLILASANAYPVNTSLTIAAGAQVTIANHSSNATYVPVASALVNTGTLDLTNNAMVVHNGSIGTITAQVELGYNNGAWSGTNAGSGVITSSLAAADATHLTAVGVATGLTSFEGGTVLASDVLMKYTYYGDANLDGRVDGSDYSRIDSSFLSEGSGPAVTGWYNGDFNYDNVVNGSDYTLIDNAFNSQGVTLTAEIASPTAQIAGSGATSAVPEPTTLGLLGIAAVGLLGRRHRRISKAR